MHKAQAPKDWDRLHCIFRKGMEKLIFSREKRWTGSTGLSLIANTAPVAYGALGTPIIALAGVTGIEIQKLSAMVGRQLPFFSIIVPFWLVWAFARFNGMIEIWPALLVAGTLFAIPQFLISNLHGPWLMDIIASVVSMFGLIIFLLFWHPRRTAPAESWAR